MNNTRLFVSALFAAAAATPFAFASDMSPGASNANQQAPRVSGEISVRRVSDDAVKMDITAKDFIGKSVYDSAGEKLGEILDVHLDLGRGEASRNLLSKGEAPRESVVYISVGGLFGMGDEIVTVPTAELRLETGKDRFTLNVRKADFVAIAKQEAPAVATEEKSGSASYAGPTQATSDDVDNVRSALMHDSEIGPIASRVSVTTSGGSLVLSGRIDKQSQKDRIVTLARKATAKPVTDKLELASN